MTRGTRGSSAPYVAIARPVDGDPAPGVRQGGPVRNGEYGLGIDVGDGAVTAAVCAVHGGAGALPVGQGRVTAAVGDDGRVGLVPADGTARSRPLVARVGDPVPVYTGGRAVPAAELVAAAVEQVRELAAERAGRPDAWTVVTVPPSWAGHRCAALAHALTAAGVPRFSLVSSAVAAVSAHVAAGDLPAEPTVAVYDLGAGTLDTAVVGPTADQPLAHLAVPPAPLPWGGRDVDDAVVAHVVDCLGTPGGDAAALRVACVRAKEALSGTTAVRVGDGPRSGSPARSSTRSCWSRRGGRPRHWPPRWRPRGWELPTWTPSC